MLFVSNSGDDLSFSSLKFQFFVEFIIVITDPWLFISNHSLLSLSNIFNIRLLKNNETFLSDHLNYEETNNNRSNNILLLIDRTSLFFRGGINENTVYESLEEEEEHEHNEEEQEQEYNEEEQEYNEDYKDDDSIS